MRSPPHSSHRPHSAGLIVSTAFYILTVGDMFYTARYFHDRSESVGAALLGLVLFQVPLAYWLLSANT